MGKTISTLWGIMILLIVSVGVFVFVNRSASDLEASAIEVNFQK